MKQFTRKWLFAWLKEKPMARLKMMNGCNCLGAQVYREYYHAPKAHYGVYAGTLDGFGEPIMAPEWFSELVSACLDCSHSQIDPTTRGQVLRRWIKLDSTIRRMK